MHMASLPVKLNPAKIQDGCRTISPALSSTFLTYLMITLALPRLPPLFLKTTFKRNLPNLKTSMSCILPWNNNYFFVLVVFVQYPFKPQNGQNRASTNGQLLF